MFLAYKYGEHFPNKRRIQLLGFKPSLCVFSMVLAFTTSLTLAQTTGSIVGEVKEAISCHQRYNNSAKRKNQ